MCTESESFQQIKKVFALRFFSHIICTCFWVLFSCFCSGTEMEIHQICPTPVQQRHFDLHRAGLHRLVSQTHEWLRHYASITQIHGVRWYNLAPNLLFR
jgi:hypothetical protein